jgi:LAO/AO transport system kinase
MQALATWRKTEGHWSARRSGQALYWFQTALEQGVLSVLRTPEARALKTELAAAVGSGVRSPDGAARQLLSRLGVDAG